jgi:DNA-directed RNA polymerase subunit K
VLNARFLIPGENLIWPTDKFTRFEVARLLGARSLQIALGAPVLIKSNSGNAIDTARLEFKEKLVPITVKRKLPDGTYTVVQSKKAVENWLVDNNGEI